MIRVMVVDDEELMRCGLRAVLGSSPDVAVVAEASSCDEAVGLANAQPIDVVLLDVTLPQAEALSAMQRLRALPAPPRVLLLTPIDPDQWGAGLLDAGAAGFVPKYAPPRELVHAVRLVAAGHSPQSPAAAHWLIAHFAGGSGARRGEARRYLEGLTDRQQTVLRLVGQGLSDAEIASRLAVGETVIKADVERILARIGAGNRVQAAILAHRAAQADDPRNGGTDT